MAIGYSTIECNACGWQGIENDLVKVVESINPRTVNGVVMRETIFAEVCPDCASGDDLADAQHHSTNGLPDGYFMRYP